jgi:hypothetical protein
MKFKPVTGLVIGFSIVLGSVFAMLRSIFIFSAEEYETYQQQEWLLAGFAFIGAAISVLSMRAWLSSRNSPGLSRDIGMRRLFAKEPRWW